MAAAHPTLRLTSWLAPSIPVELHRALADHLAGALGAPVELRFETARSAPEGDPFADGATDLGWMCAPGYLRLADRGSIALLPAPCPDDPRAGGRPVYFSDVVVRAADPARGFADLHGRTWAFNDPCSLSGWLALRRHLAACDGVRLLASGSHVRSLAMIAAGQADAAAVDSQALALATARDPALAASLRVIDSWGPFPIQPLVAGARLPAATRAAVAAALLAVGPRLRRWRVLGFAPVTEVDYRDEALARLCEAAGDAAWP
ncbi:MAG TPA: PhnD/SsuA/transferrin family substrate-binding protein [Kofleriaceae bacterium]|nr:PhnD/SsuA/transferrin family substrate-binding protein [Kofleriaceae bacterium]